MNTAESAQEAMAALENRLERIHQACSGTMPKQAVGEMIATMQKMPEWAVVRSALRAGQPKAPKIVGIAVTDKANWYRLQLDDGTAVTACYPDRQPRLLEELDPAAPILNDR